MPPLTVWGGAFYAATLAALVIPSFFLYRPDDPPSNHDEGNGLFKDREGDSQTRLQLFLLFMIPAMAALNALFIYLVHYRHIRRQQYRVEVNEGDNLLFSTAARSLFADKRLRRRLRASRIDPLVLYEGYAGILPVHCSPTAGNFAMTCGGTAGAGNSASSPAGVSASSGVDLGASVFGIRLDGHGGGGGAFDTTLRGAGETAASGIDFGATHGGGDDSAKAGGGKKALVKAVENAKDWYTVEGTAAPSMLLRRLRGRVRPVGVSGHGPDTGYVGGRIMPSDVRALTEEAQRINEASASIRYEVSRQYAAVLGDNDVVREAVSQMQEERARRLQRRRAQAERSEANTSVNMSVFEPEIGGTPPPALMARRPSDVPAEDFAVRGAEGGAAPASFNDAAPLSTVTAGERPRSRRQAAKNAIDNPLRLLVRNYQSMTAQPAVAKKGGWSVWGDGERESGEGRNKENNGGRRAKSRQQRQSEVTVHTPKGNGASAAPPAVDPTMVEAYLDTAPPSGAGGGAFAPFADADHPLGIPRQGSAGQELALGPSSPIGAVPLHMRATTLEGPALNSTNAGHNLTTLSNTMPGQGGRPTPPTAAGHRHEFSGTAEEPVFAPAPAAYGSGGGRSVVDAAALFANATANADRREPSAAPTLSEASSALPVGGGAPMAPTMGALSEHQRLQGHSGGGQSARRPNAAGERARDEHTSQWVLDQQRQR